MHGGPDAEKGPALDPEVDHQYRPGFDIALAGIDGVGKSTVSDGIAAELRRRGYLVTVTSWREYLRTGSMVDEKSPLRGLYAAQLRALFSACVGPDGMGAEQLLAGLDRDLAGGPGRPMILDDPSVRVALNHNRLNTFLAGGLLDVAARLIERDTVIGPALARGEVVIQESHGLKNCVKFGVMAEHLARHGGRADQFDQVAGSYLSVVRRCLTQWAPPTVTVLVVGDPSLAMAWRRRQKGFIPRGEHLDEDGRPAEWTFVELQTEVQGRLIAIGEAEGWPRVTMTSRPQRLNVALAVETVLDALADREILSREPAR
jgi:hypothetical protein